jgi:hypothetical protein
MSNYQFYPSLLDSFQSYLDTSYEDFWYQDEAGGYHKNFSEDTGYHLSPEEVDVLAKQKLLDALNRVPFVSEAASKGTMFNEILDCIIQKRGCTEDGKIIKTVRSPIDLANAICPPMIDPAISEEDIEHQLNKEADAQMTADEIFSKIGKPFIFASCDGFRFCFDIGLCTYAANYFIGSSCQVLTEAELKTAYGGVRLYGYADYVKENKVYDAKTTGRYEFGNYSNHWQRYAYPYTLLKSGMCAKIDEFEFSVFLLRGGTSRTPLITGELFPEVYHVDYNQCEAKLRMQCERLIEFIEENKDLINNKKVLCNE